MKANVCVCIQDKKKPKITQWGIWRVDCLNEVNDRRMKARERERKRKKLRDREREKEKTKKKKEKNGQTFGVVQVYIEGWIHVEEMTQTLSNFFLFLLHLCYWIGEIYIYICCVFLSSADNLCDLYLFVLNYK